MPTGRTLQLWEMRASSRSRKQGPSLPGWIPGTCPEGSQGSSLWLHCHLAFPSQGTRPHTQLYRSTLTVPPDQLPSDLGSPDTRWRAQPPRSGEHQELS